MERTQYAATSPVPMPPPDPGELRVYWSEANAQNDGPGWIVFTPGSFEIKAFWRERSALKEATKGEQ